MAIDEAKKASDDVFPNPKVGCVIVQNGKIVSKGYHQKFGGPHAEAEALNNCDTQLKDATMYVTLEPCNHYGKTAPCTTLIEPEKFKRIVVCELNAGQFANYLRMNFQGFIFEQYNKLQGFPFTSIELESHFKLLLSK